MKFISRALIYPLRSPPSRIHKEQNLPTRFSKKISDDVYRIVEKEIQYTVSKTIISRRVKTKLNYYFSVKLFKTKMIIQALIPQKRSPYAVMTKKRSMQFLKAAFCIETFGVKKFNNVYKLFRFVAT